MRRIACMIVLTAAWLARAQFEVPNPPRITAIHSPKTTIELRWGTHQKFLRRAEQLPSEPFLLTTQVNDIVEVVFPDETVVRQGPNTQVYFMPSSNLVQVVTGSVIAKIPEKTEVFFRVPEVKAKDCILLTTVSTQGIKTFSLSGEFDFKGKTVKEGEMYFQNASPELQGPFLIDLVEMIASSPLTIEFPKHPWIKAAMKEPIENQKRMKDWGLVAPANTALQGSGAQVTRDNRLPPPHKKGKLDDDD